MSLELIDTINEKRFSFGKNWNSFLDRLDDKRIEEAKDSLKFIFSKDNFKDKSFLDVGSGSGIFSLAAILLGARNVYSVDLDKDSVECSKLLMDKYKIKSSWKVEQKSILDKSFLDDTPAYDYVYSWGVLHHTGDMWKALHNITSLVKEDGYLSIAIYNDQEIQSKFWKKIKEIYCTNFLGKIFVNIIFIPNFLFIAFVKEIIKKNNPFRLFKSYKKKRGMSLYHDWIDWLGGHPFEVAKPEEIIEFYKKRGFQLTKLVTTNRSGCNQFTFHKVKRH